MNDYVCKYDSLILDMTDNRVRQFLNIPKNKLFDESANSYLALSFFIEISVHKIYA